MFDLNSATCMAQVHKEVAKVVEVTMVARVEEAVVKAVVVESV